MALLGRHTPSYCHASCSRAARVKAKLGDGLVALRRDHRQGLRPWRCHPVLNHCTLNRRPRVYRLPSTSPACFLSWHSGISRLPSEARCGAAVRRLPACPCPPGPRLPHRPPRPPPDRRPGSSAVRERPSRRTPLTAATASRFSSGRWISGSNSLTLATLSAPLRAVSPRTYCRYPRRPRTWC